MPEISGHVIKLFRDCRGGGAGRATAQPLLCLGLRLQDKYSSMQMPLNGGTVTPDACLCSLVRVFSPTTSSLRSLLFLSHDQDLAIY